MTAAVRGVRSDARRNHQSVLDAARELLTEHGADMSMEQVAACAGVGVGTVYRHFPSKDALIAALVEAFTAELVADGEHALTLTDGTGLEVFLQSIGRSFGAHRLCSGLMLEESRSRSVAGTVRSQLATLFTRAQQGGRVSEHAEFGDVMALIWSMRGLVETAGAVAPDSWRRFLDLHLQALRSPEVASAHKALGRAQIRRVWTG